uniref:non-specific serine/threonine protein kinase n=1 Tax=Palpitomonas bilix TaxID=652834 RepID=A0A7S3FZ10_9EUKA
MIGTPFNLSPELINGQPYGSKSDLWALGCVMYELATCTNAFKGRNVANIAMKIMKQQYTPLPDGVYSSTFMLMQKSFFLRNPKNRPSAEDILDEPIVKEAMNKKRNIRMPSKSKKRGGDEDDAASAASTAQLSATATVELHTLRSTVEEQRKEMEAASQREAELKERIRQLEERLAAVEGKGGSTEPST